MEYAAAAKRAGVWIRVSTEDQVRGESAEHHERRARAYAEVKGWDVVETYRLEAVSGKAVMGHSEAQRMLADVRSGKITALVFSKLARLARNTRELLEFAEIFRACGADLVSLQEAIDTSSPAGRLFFTMIAAMAQWEREEIASRVQASVPIRAKLGKPLGGAAPFGYRWRNKQIEPDPGEAPVRKLLYELFDEHQRMKTVARILNERGHRTRNGSPFSDTTVTRLIQDPTAKGLHRANYTRTDDHAKSWTLKPEDEWVYTQVEPIVSEDLWERCNAVLNNRKGKKQPTRKVAHLFAGYAFCHCGEKMYVWSNSPKYVCPKCRNKIPVNDLEAVYREQLHGFLLSPEQLAQHYQDADATVAERENLIASMQTELTRINAEDERLYQLYLSGNLSPEDFGRRQRPLSERRAQIEDELPRVQAQLDVLRIGISSQAETLEEARDLWANWEKLSREDKRSVIEAITDRIIIGKDDVDIILLHLPSGPSGPDESSSAGTDADKATRACRCGHLGDAALSCARAPRCAADYQAKVSGPLLDRIDLHVEVQPVSAADLVLPPPAEGSSEVAARVAEARAIQTERYREVPARTNAEADGELLTAVATPDDPGRKLLAQASEAMRLSARGYTRVLRVARTIADLAGAEGIGRIHVAEALSYRRQAPRS